MAGTDTPAQGQQTATEISVRGSWQRQTAGSASPTKAPRYPADEFSSVPYGFPARMARMVLARMLRRSTVHRLYVEAILQYGDLNIPAWAGLSEES